MCEYSGHSSSHSSGCLEPFLNVRKTCNEARTGFLTLLERNMLRVVLDIVLNSTSVSRSLLFLWWEEKALANKLFSLAVSQVSCPNCCVGACSVTSGVVLKRQAFRWCVALRLVSFLDTNLMG